MNHAFAFQLNQVLDEYDDQHRRLEATINALPPQVALTEPVWYERTHELAHAQANVLAELGGVG